MHNFYCRFCLFVCLFAFLFPGVSYSIDWTSTNQATFAWEPVATLSNGNPVPATDVISYDVYLVSDTGDKNADMFLLGNTEDLQFVATFTIEGKYFIGVRAVRSRDGAVISRSIFAWSDNPVVVLDGNTFGIVYFMSPGDVSGLNVLKK